MCVVSVIEPVDQSMYTLMPTYITVLVWIQILISFRN